MQDASPEQDALLHLLERFAQCAPDAADSPLQELSPAQLLVVLVTLSTWLYQGQPATSSALSEGEELVHRFLNLASGPERAMMESMLSVVRPLAVTWARDAGLDHDRGHQWLLRIRAEVEGLILLFES